MIFLTGSSFQRDYAPKKYADNSLDNKPIAASYSRSAWGHHKRYNIAPVR